MINVLSNNSSSITYLFFVFLIFSFSLIVKCTTAKKTSRSKKEQSVRQISINTTTNKIDDGQTDDVNDESTDANNDNHMAELLNDYLSNVQLLAPTLPGGCNEDNAAKEALGRYTTNTYLPKLELQKERILDDTTPFDIRAMVDALPRHPSRRFRAKIVNDQTAILKARQEKWKNTHVTWHPVGLVYMVRSSDACRARDEGVVDTVDSLDADSPEAAGGEDKVNSEMTMSQRKTMIAGEKNKKSRRSLRSTKKSKKGGGGGGESKKEKGGALKVDKTMATSENTIFAEQETQKVNDK